VRRLLQFSRDLKASYGASDGRNRVAQLNRELEEVGRRTSSEGSVDHAATTGEYYDLCTDVMVFFFGESLHFAPLSPDESLTESKIRHQRLMIEKLDLHEGMSVVDIGCGIGGPMRRVVEETGVRVTGVNNSRVQLAKAKSLNAAAGINGLVDYLECSFMDMGMVADDTFDRGYAIESTCHAPDKAAAFAEIYRVLKPGALLWGQEMCLTDTFDPDNARHQAVKQELMRGISLKKIATFAEVDQALASAGFEVIEGMDRETLPTPENGSTTPWYQPMEDRGGKLGGALHASPLGRRLIIGVLRIAEAVKVLPRGAADVAGLLDNTASAYIAGGKTGVFTPLYCFVARKPG
jgi:sterol 24-C-methyltransferase